MSWRFEKNVKIANEVALKLNCGRVRRRESTRERQKTNEEIKIEHTLSKIEQTMKTNEEEDKKKK